MPRYPITPCHEILRTGFFELAVDVCHAVGCQGIEVTGKDGYESYGGGDEGHEHTEAEKR